MVCKTSQLQQILQNTTHYLLPQLPKVELNSYLVSIILSCVSFLSFFFFIFMQLYGIYIIEVKGKYSGTPRYGHLVRATNFKETKCERVNLC